MFPKFATCLLLFFTLVVHVNSDVTKVRSDLLSRVLDKKYIDHRIRPSCHNETHTQSSEDPCQINVRLYIHDIYKLCPKSMDLSMLVTLEQSWTDKRLKYTEDWLSPLNIIDNNAIWIPDTYINNEMQPNDHKQNRKIQIYSNGTVFMSIYANIVVSCPMNLGDFPFDKPCCRINLASYNYPENELHLQWVGPLNITKGQMVIDNYYSIVNHHTSKSNQGPHSLLVARIQFSRWICYYIMMYYIPLTSLIIIAWFTFWLDHRKYLFPRIFIAMTTMITTFLFIIYINNDFPRSKGTKAIDLWTGVALSLIFTSIVELVYIIYRDEHPGSTELIQEKGADEEDKPMPELEPLQKSGCKKVYTSLIHKIRSSKSNRIDVYMRIGYPIAFFTFAFIYIIVFTFKIIW